MWKLTKLKFTQPSTWAGIGTTVVEIAGRGMNAASVAVILAGAGNVLANA